MEQPTYLQAMLEQAQRTKQHAYAPYSHFAVGACLRTVDGALFSGANMENASYGLTLCAEAGALLAMVASGARQVTDIVVVSDAPGFCPPCGACRQRLQEFAAPNLTVHLFNQQGSYQARSMVELLPFPFDNTLLK